MHQNKTILVVDDDPKIIILASDFLEFKGYKIKTARNGREGIEAASDEDIDLIILDVMMPEVDGFQACRVIKLNPRTKNIPILMLTALGNEKDEILAFDCGADDYLSKPYDNGVLLARIESLLKLYTRISSNKPEARNYYRGKSFFDFLNKHFDREELITLCNIHLELDYASLPGEGREAKVRELVLSLQRRGRLNELAKLCEELRPNIPLEE